MNETSPGGYVFGHPEVAADCGAVADGDASEDGGVRVDYDVVFKDGVTRDVLDGMAVGVEGETLGTQGDALVKFDIIAYNARGADDDTRAVVYGEVMAYLRRRVDVGRVDLMKKFSFFEVDEKETEHVLKAFRGLTWNGRKVVVEIAQEESPEEFPDDQPKGSGRRNRKRSGRRRR